MLRQVGSLARLDHQFAEDGLFRGMDGFVEFARASGHRRRGLIRSIAPAAAVSTTNDDVDLTSGGGKECSSNKDCLSGERHAGTFERNDAKDYPWAVDWDQANQGIGQRSKLRLLRFQIRQDAITTLAANCLDGGIRNVDDISWCFTG